MGVSQVFRLTTQCISPVCRIATHGYEASTILASAFTDSAMPTRCAASNCAGEGSAGHLQSLRHHRQVNPGKQDIVLRLQLLQRIEQGNAPLPVSVGGGKLAQRTARPGQTGHAIVVEEDAKRAQHVD